MATKKKTKEAMTILAGEVHADRMLSKRDGTFEMRFGFFYRHGKTSEKMAIRVLQYGGASVKIVNHSERWQAWPKDSYWSVFVKVTDADALIKMAETVCEEHKCEWDDLVEENKANWS